MDIRFGLARNNASHMCSMADVIVGVRVRSLRRVGPCVVADQVGASGDLEAWTEASAQLLLVSCC